MEMQALIEEIAALAEKIKSGTAVLSELEAFAAATQQLNERAIILRYKAIEAKVYASTPLSDRKLSTHDEPENSPVADVAKDKEPIEMSAPASVEDSGDLSFDLFSMDTEDASAPFSVHEEESKNVVEETQTAPVAEESAATFTPEVKEDTPAAATPAFEETKYPETDVQPEPIPVQPEPPVYPETDVQPEPAPAPAAPVSSGNEHPVIQRALRNDGSLQSRLLSVRLETLKSAFGLNERMLIVRELFGGSNDAYNEAIELLDNQPEIGPARAKVSTYANQYGWGEDNELAIEFVQKVVRRYA